MRWIQGIVLTGCMVSLTCQPALAEEEFSAEYFAEAIVEVFHAHGLTVGSYGAARMDGDVLVLAGLRAFGADGKAGFSAKEVKVSGIGEENDGPEPWLSMAGVSASGVDVAAGGYAVHLGDVRIEGLMLQNSNTPEDGAKNGYRYIDGAFSALKFTSAEIRGAYALHGGETLVRIGEVKVEADGWFDEFTVPSVSSFSISGTALPAAWRHVAGLEREAADYEASGRFVIDAATGLASADLSAATSMAGEAVTRVTLAGVKRRVLAWASSWAEGDEEAGRRLLDEVRLARLAAAARGTGWAAGLEVPLLGPLKERLSPAASMAAADGLGALTATGGDAVVVEMLPPGRLRLSDLAAGGDAKPGEIGFSVR